MTEDIFKICSNCQAVWNTRREFLADPELTVIGYQVHFSELSAGMFLFNHSCRTTISVQAMDFLDLYDGPMFEERVTGSEHCPEFCQHCDKLEFCPQECECAYVRAVLQIVRNWPKVALSPP